MDEAAVKAQVLAFIREAGGSREAVVTAEFSLGRSGIRADLALLADDELVGIEIKPNATLCDAFLPKWMDTRNILIMSSW